MYKVPLQLSSIYLSMYLSVCLSAYPSFPMSVSFYNQLFPRRSWQDSQINGRWTCMIGDDGSGSSVVWYASSVLQSNSLQRWFFEYLFHLSLFICSRHAVEWCIKCSEFLERCESTLSWEVQTFTVSLCPFARRISSHLFSLFAICVQPLATGEHISAKKPTTNPLRDTEFPDPQKSGNSSISPATFVNSCCLDE